MGCANETAHSLGSGSANARFVDRGGFDDVNFSTHSSINSRMISTPKFLRSSGAASAIPRSLAYASALNAELGESVTASEPLRLLQVNHDGTTTSGFKLSFSSRFSKSDPSVTPSNVRIGVGRDTSHSAMAPMESCVNTSVLFFSTLCRTIGLTPITSIDGTKSWGSRSCGSPQLSNFRGVVPPNENAPGEPTSNHVPGCRKRLDPAARRENDALVGVP